jgi:manganese/zinc/iron transport system permease protein
MDLLFDYTFRTVALGAAVLGIVSGVLGSFAVLRRQGLLGDALSHAALPGVCAAFALTGSKAPLTLLAGAAIAGWLGALALIRITRSTRVSEDSALGIVLSTFFAAGIMMLTAISRSGDATQAGLDKFLFGQAAAIVADDVLVMAVLGGGALLIVALLYKEFKLITFDVTFAASLGFSTGVLGTLLTALAVIAIVIGLKTVGVVLMASLLIGPAVAARQWTNRLSVMLILSGLFGAASGVIGAAISFADDGLPTGPMVILALTAIVLLSLFFAPERGLLFESLRRWSARRATGVRA